MRSILMDLQIAARSLGRHGRRTLLLGGALAVITALLVLLVGLTDGIHERILRTASTLMTGHVNVAGFYKVTAGAAVPLVTDYEKVLAAVKPEVPELEWAVARGRGNAKAISETRSLNLVLGGVQVENDPGFATNVPVLEGDIRELARPNTILLFHTVAKKLGVKVGDVITLSAPTYRGMANTMDARVAAIAKDIGVLSYFNAYLSFASLQSLYQMKPGSAGAIFLYLRDQRAAPEVAMRLREVLARKGWRVMEADSQPYWAKLYTKVTREDWTGQKIDVTTWSDETGFMTQTNLLLELLAGYLLLLLELILAAGMMSTMWIAIRERTREIGTLRAIGMHRERVLFMFLAEAALLGLCGTVTGALLGVAGVHLVNAARIGAPEAVQWIVMGDRITLALQPAKLLWSCLGLTAVTAVSALLPALRAARLKPVTAMHHIG